MLLKLSILDSQSFVLHQNGIEFHQGFNGSDLVSVGRASAVALSHSFDISLSLSFSDFVRLRTVY